jgi:hypothetical protein
VTHEFSAIAERAAEMDEKIAHRKADAEPAPEEASEGGDAGGGEPGDKGAAGTARASEGGRSRRSRKNSDEDRAIATLEKSKPAAKVGRSVGRSVRAGALVVVACRADSFVARRLP